MASERLLLKVAEDRIKGSGLQWVVLLIPVFFLTQPTTAQPLLALKSLGHLSTPQSQETPAG
jgi:hypothetical protein